MNPFGWVTYAAMAIAVTGIGLFIYGAITHTGWAVGAGIAVAVGVLVLFFWALSQVDFSK